MKGGVLTMEDIQASGADGTDKGNYTCIVQWKNQTLTRTYLVDILSKSFSINK